VASAMAQLKTICRDAFETRLKSSVEIIQSRLHLVMREFWPLFSEKTGGFLRNTL
jgi:hypothetical protein